MTEQIALDENARAKEADGGGMSREVASDLAYLRTAIVNVMFVGPRGAGDRNWVLVDAGVIGTGSLIKAAAAARFGPGSRPSAIVLTHGHFDHVGVLETLAEEWDTPVFAHELEVPYLSGAASYPPGDPSVGGGLIAASSPLFPTKPVNVSARLQKLPADGSIPPMPDWRWIHTPGHSVGHVSFWRERDRALLAGDAFVTTKQESAYAVLTQASEMHGPPQYLTIDWIAAEESVRRLAALQPELAITGHGRPVAGAPMRSALEMLSKDFARVARPTSGVYLTHPATIADGSAYRAVR